MCYHYTTLSHPCKIRTYIAPIMSGAFSPVKLRGINLLYSTRWDSNPYIPKDNSFQNYRNNHSATCAFLKEYWEKRESNPYLNCHKVIFYH